LSFARNPLLLISQFTHNTKTPLSCLFITIFVYCSAAGASVAGLTNDESEYEYQI